MGRPSKLTPEIQEQICKTLTAGVDLTTACAREGVAYRTLREWMQRAQNGEEKYLDFMCATAAAEANVEVHVTANILRKSQNNWQAGAWWLKWKRTRGVQVQRLDVSVAQGESSDLLPHEQGGLQRRLTPDGAAAIRRQILFGESPRALPQDAAEPHEPDDAETLELKGEGHDFGTEPKGP